MLPSKTLLFPYLPLHTKLLPVQWKSWSSLSSFRLHGAGKAVLEWWFSEKQAQKEQNHTRAKLSFICGCQEEVQFLLLLSVWKQPFSSPTEAQVPEQAEGADSGPQEGDARSCCSTSPAHTLCFPQVRVLSWLPLIIQLSFLIAVCWCSIILL